MSETNELTRWNVWWNDLLPAASGHVAQWVPNAPPTIRELAEDLAAYLRRTTPDDTHVEVQAACGETEAHVYLRWQGMLFRPGLALEIVAPLVSRRDYDALVGRLEQLDEDIKRVVVLVGARDEALVERLEARYRRSLSGRMAIVGVERSELRKSAESVEETQLPERLQAVIDEEVALYDASPIITIVDRLPDTTAIPIQDPLQWQQVDDAICVFVDMKGSTALSAAEHAEATARVYRLFTGTVVRILHSVGAAYIDVQGDGAFALFDAEQVHRALAAAVTCKTFGSEVFAPRVKAETGVEVGCHVGIDQGVLLVRKIGLKRHGGRSDRQNEVWAGRAVNMAAKLAAMGGLDELHVSDRFHARITDSRGLQSCGCSTGAGVDLWTTVDVASVDQFDFSAAYRLGLTGAVRTAGSTAPACWRLTVLVSRAKQSSPIRRRT